LTLSAPVKIFAVLAVVLAVAGVGFMTFMAPADVEETAAPIILPKKTQGVLQTPAAAKKVQAKANAASKAKTNAASTTTPAKPTPASTTAGKPVAPKAEPEPEPAPSGVAANGLPMQLAAALNRNDVVVVALWGTGGKIDEMSRDEAAAGAALSGAEFVPINVIDNAKAAEALTLKLGFVLRAPGVLVYTRPATLANRLDGFRDRETVAQAVVDSLR
jgi:hypothetical protein